MDRRQSEWISISDMMAGLMMIFLLVALSYMVVANSDRKKLARKNQELQDLNQKMGDVAQSYESLQRELHKDLTREFSKDLQRWNAVIDADNTIRFNEQDVLFDSGASRVKDKFKKILGEFFPRYIKILSQEKYKDDIEEIRIEGHTSREWANAKTLESQYLENASLSQARAFSVLHYCFGLEAIADKRAWLIGVLRANGLSFAKPRESEALSRRVEFRAIPRSQQSILKILDLSKEQ